MNHHAQADEHGLTKHLPPDIQRVSHMTASFLHRVKIIVSFPIFALLLASSMGAYRNTSNKNGGKLTCSEGRKRKLVTQIRDMAIKRIKAYFS
jgi:hypothetical protein